MEEQIKRIEIETCKKEKVKPVAGGREEEEPPDVLTAEESAQTGTRRRAANIRDFLNRWFCVEKGLFYLRHGQRGCGYLATGLSRVLFWTEIHSSSLGERSTSVSTPHLSHCLLLAVYLVVVDQMFCVLVWWSGPANDLFLMSAPPSFVCRTGHARTRPMICPPLFLLIISQLSRVHSAAHLLPGAPSWIFFHPG